MNDHQVRQISSKTARFVYTGITKLTLKTHSFVLEHK